MILENLLIMLLINFIMKRIFVNVHVFLCLIIKTWKSVNQKYAPSTIDLLRVII